MPKTTDTTTIERTLPFNLDAEVSVLGSLLLDKDAITKIADILSADDFYDDRHKIIFQSIVELFEKRRPVDLVTLTNKLQEKKEFDNIGGASYLATLANSVSTSSHIKHHATIVADKASLRRLVEAGSKITGLALTNQEDVDSVLDEAEQIVFGVAQRKLKQNFIPLKSVLTETFERIDELHQNKEQIRGLPTGFPALDSILAGLQSSDLIIVAGRPSMGKTAFALNIAQHVAAREGIPVGVFSLEQSKEQIVDRLLCNEARIDSWKLRTGNLDDDDFPRLGHAMAVLSEAPLFIDDSATNTVLDMRTKARRLQAEHGLGLIIVDYLQLMQGRSRYADSRVQEISEISRSLKGLARELNVPVIALSQLSRKVEDRPSKIPQLSDLRESGSIEQDADVVAFIYREDYYDQETEKKHIADILIKKHRNGPIGSVSLYFVPEQMAFRNIDKKRDEK